MVTFKTADGVSATMVVFENNWWNRNLIQGLVKPLPNGTVRLGEESVQSLNQEYNCDLLVRVQTVMTRPVGGWVPGVPRTASGTSRLFEISDSHAAVISEEIPALIVDVTNLFQMRSQAAERVFGRAPMQDDMSGLAIATSLIVGLATGIAALGPVGALPAGALMTIGVLVMFAFKKQDPPAPPNIAQIKAAVAEAVDDVFKRTEADRISNNILTNVEKFLDLSRHVAGEIKSGSDATAWSDALANMAETVYMGTDDGSFQSTINNLDHSPDKAARVLPLYALGIAVYLHFCRTHLLNQALKNNTPPSTEDIEVFLGDVIEAKDGLEAAIAKFEADLEDDIRIHGLKGLSEERGIRLLWCTARLQQEDTRGFHEMKASLNQMITALELDIEGPITHFFNEAWLRKIPTGQQQET